MGRSRRVGADGGRDRDAGTKQRSGADDEGGLNVAHAHASVHDFEVDPRREILTPAEVRQLLDACSSRASSGLRNRALIVVFYRAGLRVNEALRLMPDDIDARARELIVRRDTQSRRVPLDLGSFRVIERWLERRRMLGIEDDAPVFCTLSGKPVASSYLRGLMHRLAEKAGVEKRVSAEVLRRSLAIELVEEGFSIVAIQAQLGHSAAAVTSRYLARLERHDEREGLRHRSEWLP